ncbi:hypothetical protein [Absidia glauca]|uniref:Uncharacterized protein n=1 Tax=Absidia glauca TaxID=4829 RepID=A0A168KJD5_ABSGL|nr:hypothetical protein [Absidia glauca]
MKSLWIHCCPIKLLNLQRSFFVTPSPPPILRLFGGQLVMGKRTHRSAIYSQDDGTGNFKAHIFQDYTNSYEAQYSTEHTIPGVTQETAHDHDASFNFIRHVPILLRYPISVTKQSGPSYDMNKTTIKASSRQCNLFQWNPPDLTSWNISFVCVCRSLTHLFWHPLAYLHL